jgi:3',5'-cyclic AMP phosphodiesterase CpdA
MRTVAQISDLHFGRHSTTVAEDLLASVGEHDPHLVVLSGDFTQRARHEEFAEARRFISRIAQPKIVVPGNHDVPLYDLIARFLTPLAKYEKYISPAGLAGSFFRDQEIAVLGINTARRFTRKNGRVSLQQIAQIRRVFCEVPKPLFKALVTHHPLGVPIDADPLELAGRALLALEAVAHCGVHLLFSGHHHRALSGHILDELGCRASVLILHAGTAISTRIRGIEGNTYNLVRIDGDRVGVTVMAWEAGQRFRASRHAAYAFADDKWHAVNE